MLRLSDLLLTASAPAIWGSTYIVTSQLLPPGYPLTNAVLRALPAGLLLMALVRKLPPLNWLAKLSILGLLNFSIFWTALFVAAYRLPGGVAATLGAVQPLMVLLLARIALATPLTVKGIGAAIAGIGGVALLVVEPRTELDPIGVTAAIIGAASMALGVVLTRKWRPDVSTLTFTAWQLTAGGLLLVPIALALEPSLPAPSAVNLAGWLWLGLFGAAISYFFWFRGIDRLGPAAVTSFGLLSPLTAVLLGWALLGEALTPSQLVGVAIVLISVWTASRSGSRSGSHKQNSQGVKS